MKKYNSFLGAFLSGDDGKSGYNAGYRKSALAELYQSQDPMKQQEALNGLARVDPEAAGGWQRDNQAAVQQHAKLLVALGKDNPVAVQAWETRVKPELVRMYGEQAAALTLEEAMPYAEQIAGQGLGGQRVHSQYMGADGKMRVIMSDGTEKEMGAYNPKYKMNVDAFGNVFGFNSVDNSLAPTAAAPIGGSQQGQSPQMTEGDLTTYLNALNAKSQELRAAGVPLEQINAWADEQVASLPKVFSANPTQAKVGVKPEAPKDPKTAVVYDADGNASVVDVSKPGPIAGAVRPGSQLSAKDKQKLETMKRKEFNLVNSNAAKINETVRIIDELLGSGALGGVTGIGAVGSKIPGTKWADAAAKLETLRAKSAFGALSEMRANSPTGGALGSVTERELSLLQNAETQLSQAQSPEAFAKALTEYKRILLESQKRMVEGVQGFYANESQAPSAPAGEPQRIRIKL